MTKTRAELLAAHHAWTTDRQWQRPMGGQAMMSAGIVLLGEAMDWIARQPDEPADEQRCAWCGEPMDDETVALAKRCDVLAPEGQALCSLRCFREIRRPGATPDDFRPFNGTVTDFGGGEITIRVDRGTMQYAPASMRVRVSEGRDGTRHQG